MNDTRGIPIIPGGRAGTREYNLECLEQAERGRRLVILLGVLIILGYLVAVISIHE